MVSEDPVLVEGKSCDAPQPEHSVRIKAGRGPTSDDERCIRTSADDLRDYIFADAHRGSSSILSHPLYPRLLHLRQQEIEQDNIDANLAYEAFCKEKADGLDVMSHS
jgi:hypothetical protein